MRQLSVNQRFWGIAPLLVLAILIASLVTGAPTSDHSPVTATPPVSSLAAPVAPTAAAPVPTVVIVTPPPVEPVATATLAVPTPTPVPVISNPTPRPAAPVPDDPSQSLVYETGSGERPEIALTFDAGSDRGFTEQILDTLHDTGVLATFGITGAWAEANPDLVQRIVEEGHQVINHTWSHESFTGYSTGEGTGITDPAGRQDQLDSTNDEIAASSDGYDTRPYWRPPYGDIDAGVLADVAQDGYTITVMWSCDTLGWNGNSADEILERCVDPAQAGDIILMHVGDGSQDAAALRTMIERLQNAGFALVTIEQLLQP